MEYKEQIREEALTYSDCSKIDISAQTGIYAYFFIHSAKFLKNSGRMGYITSNTWLDVSFGEGLKQFFLDHFKILAIIEHDAGIFKIPIVDACVTILEKVEGIAFKHDRDENIIKFVRIKKSMPINFIISFIRETDKNYEDDKIKILLKKQKELSSREKWGRYLRAPAIYFKILEKGASLFVPMRKIAKIRRGFVTGANEFFILDDNKVKLWGIEDKYLAPVISSPRHVKHIKVELNDVKEKVLMVHGPKNELKGTNVLKYIEYGENVEKEVRRGSKRGKVKGYQNLTTIKNRRFWYDLGKRTSGSILAPYMIRERFFFIWNKANAFVPNVFHEIIPNQEKDIIVLLGILNSSLTEFLAELHGRLYGAGLLKIETYEWNEFPCLNVEALSNREKQHIKEIFLKLCEAQGRGDKKTEKEIKKELDNAVFDILGLTEDERKQVYEGLESLRRMRLQRKEVEVLVETAEKWKPPKKLKKERIKIVEPSKRLDMWIEK